MLEKQKPNTSLEERTNEWGKGKVVVGRSKWNCTIGEQQVQKGRHTAGHVPTPGKNWNGENAGRPNVQILKTTNKINEMNERMKRL